MALIMIVSLHTIQKQEHANQERTIKMKGKTAINLPTQFKVSTWHRKHQMAMPSWITCSFSFYRQPYEINWMQARSKIAMSHLASTPKLSNEHDTWSNIAHNSLNLEAVLCSKTSPPGISSDYHQTPYVVDLMAYTDEAWWVTTCKCCLGIDVAVLYWHKQMQNTEDNNHKWNIIDKA